MKKDYSKVKSNLETIELMNQLKQLWLKTGKPIWKRLFDDLKRSTRRKVVVNVGKLNKVCKGNETVLVLGKVLGGYNITKPVKVIAVSFSDSAKKKIEGAKGSAVLLRNFIKKPSSKVRLIM